MLVTDERIRGQSRSVANRRRFPPQLGIGVALVAVAWPLAWSGLAPWSGYTFFPLWLGYILTVDGLTAWRSGTSLLTRNPGRFALLFVFSIPLWWLFELANRFLQNWQYLRGRSFDPIVQIALSSLAFSTVMPAIFVTAALYRTFPVFATERCWLRIAPSRPGLVAIAVLGLALFAGSLAFPDVLFPFVWIGLFLLIDVINALTGGASIAAQIAERRWDTVLVLFASGLTCGFFWEMWNAWSLPKWVYDVPLVTMPKLFEMPLLGYGGYFPFALEVYAAYHLLHTLFFRRRDSYLRLDDSEQDRTQAA
ncbi:MAG TPA: hypothetical protein VM450_03320 [Thermomicrobiales bacterium]|nr:hypothetical protein [Thermomicrobiales bacterium]